MKILIVEDNASVAGFLEQASEEAGYQVRRIGDGSEALNLVQPGSFDLILLDVMLPGLNGFELTQFWRQSGVVTPILIITARDALEDKLLGLDAGADDYIVKPFQIAELLARMRALLRRGAPPPQLLQVRDLELDPATRQARRAGQPVSLSATEYAVLEHLMRNPGRVVSRNALLQHVWQYDFGGNDNVLDVYISYLRRKIDKGRDPLIQTVRGLGFRLGPKEAAPN